MKRGGSLQRKTRLKPVSDKRRIENEQREKARRIVMQRSSGRCEARELIARVDLVAASACKGRGSEMHEKRKRSRGGSITDPLNIVWICRSCHEWTEDQPALALDVGLLVSSWA